MRHSPKFRRPELIMRLVDSTFDTECIIASIGLSSPPVLCTLDVRKEIHERACMRLLLLNLRYFIECPNLRINQLY